MNECDIEKSMTTTLRLLDTVDILELIGEGEIEVYNLMKKLEENLKDENEVYNILCKGKERYNVTYSRVSLPKQKNDLKTQSERLYNYAISNGYNIKEQFEDVKSGMSFSDRKSFCKLFDKVTNYEVKYVIVENRDRLVRFGYEFVEMFFKKFGTEIIVVSDVDNRTYEQELTDDLISIIHYYSMKSYSHRRKLHKIEEELKNNADIEN